MRNHLESEAQHYWKHVKHLRLTSDLTADNHDTVDELDVIRSMTGHAIIRRDISRALADTQTLGRAQ